MRRDDQIVGLAHLVTLALRMLTLFEVLVRRGQEQYGEEAAGIVPGPGEPDDRAPHGIAGAERDRAGGDHGDGG